MLGWLRSELRGLVRFLRFLRRNCVEALCAYCVVYVVPLFVTYVVTMSVSVPVLTTFVVTSLIWWLLLLRWVVVEEVWEE